MLSNSVFTFGNINSHAQTPAITATKTITEPMGQKTFAIIDKNAFNDLVTPKKSQNLLLNFANTTQTRTTTIFPKIVEEKLPSSTSTTTTTAQPSLTALFGNSSKWDC
jgi:hypothetical protein